MDQRPKLDDVARAAGVSRSAASRAINGQPGTTPAVRNRVREAATLLGFRPHAAARALATGRADGDRSETIEILIVEPDPNALGVKPFYGRVMAGVTDAIGNDDVSLRLRVVSVPPAVDDNPPFGRLLINVPAAAAKRLKSPHTVALGRSADDIPFVAPDNVDGARQAAAHLVSSGRRRIGAIFGPDMPCAVERKAGFLGAAAEAGQSVVSIDGDYTAPTAYAATLRLLARHPDLDTIFAVCDVTASGVLRALRQTGRRVPDDIAVVGFDGSALSEAADLSSVYLPVEEEAALAVRRVFDPGLPVARRLPAALMVRGSSTSP
ncbi:MAG TPA: LacI family DNA-binding transcriptional regulator [Micromonosporaceae bacterium]